mgnify:CR=1 FL=1
MGAVSVGLEQLRAGGYVPDIPPAPAGQSFQYTVNVLGRLTDIEQFEQIIIKTGEGGRITRLKDIARIDLGGKSYDLTSGLTGQLLFKQNGDCRQRRGADRAGERASVGTPGFRR